MRQCVCWCVEESVNARAGKVTVVRTFEHWVGCNPSVNYREVGP
jgi:hypothetical protein